MWWRLANMFLEAILLQTVPSGSAWEIMGRLVHSSETQAAVGVVRGKFIPGEQLWGGAPLGLGSSLVRRQVQADLGVWITPPPSHCPGEGLSCQEPWARTWHLDSQVSAALSLQPAVRTSTQILHDSRFLRSKRKRVVSPSSAHFRGPWAQLGGGSQECRGLT